MNQYPFKNASPYPYNLVHEVLGKEQADPPPDLDNIVEYLLETRMWEQDAFILILRYLRGMSVREIAAYYGLSDQRIRQVIRKSLRTLRHPSCSKYLRQSCAVIQRQEMCGQGARPSTS